MTGGMLIGFSKMTKIAKKEPVDLFVVQLSALLHDIADWKMYDGDIMQVNV